MKKIIEQYISVASSAPCLVYENTVKDYGKYRIEVYKRDEPEDLAYISKHKREIKAFFDAGYEHFLKNKFYSCLYANSIKENTAMLKIGRDVATEKIVAMTIYSSRWGGMKCVGGTKLVTDDIRLKELSSRAWLQITQEDVKLWGEWVWTECSQAVEVAWEKLGGIKIPHTYLDLFMDEETLADVIPNENDPYRYCRKVAKRQPEEKYVDKVIFGFPNANVLKKYIADKDTTLEELCEKYKIDIDTIVLERFNYKVLPENTINDLSFLMQYEQIFNNNVFEMTENEINVLSQCIMRVYKNMEHLWNKIMYDEQYHKFHSFIAGMMVNINRSNIIKTRKFNIDKLEPEIYRFPAHYWI